MKPAALGLAAALAGVCAGWPHLVLAATSQATAEAEAPACASSGQWYDPAKRQTIDSVGLITALAARPIVLLGETHTDADHHRWQLGMLAALHGRRQPVVLGIEALPRKAQPILDRWVAGELDEPAFLQAVEWRKVWGYDAQLYLPLFHFARLHRIKMVALNVERTLVAKVGRDGFDAVPAAEREGLSAPAPADPAYRESLVDIYLAHRPRQPEAPAPGAAAQPAPHTAAPPAAAEPDADAQAAAERTAALAEPAFGRFVEGQLTWDRAMAEALAAAQRGPDQPLVVGIIGSGHLEHGWGVPHQLAALGIADAAVLLPAPAATPCAELTAGVAEAVFLTPPAAAEAEAVERPRLGVMVEAQDGALAVLDVVEDSIAAAATMQSGDQILEAAGVGMRQPDQLVAVIERQAPGTWLPLKVRRDGQVLELVARFPVPAASEGP